jgi:hypothetical protein
MATTLELRESICPSGLDPDEQTRALAALLELTELLGLAPSPSAARRLLVDHLALYLEADAVWFVSGDADRRQIVSAALPTVTVGARIPPEDLGQLSDECRLGRRVLCVASTTRPNDSAVLCHAGFLEAREFADVATVSLAPEEPTVPGASVKPRETHRSAHATLTVAWKARAEHLSRHFAFLKAARGVLPGLLRLLDRAERSWFSRATEGFRQWASASTTRFAALLMVLAVGVLSLPVPHPIACEVEIEPIARRFVAAPFDVRLERSLVKPGDTVATGTLLARLDGRDLRVELAELAAKIGRSAKERDGHIARHETGDAELARYDLEQLTARYDLLTARVAQLEVIAPVDGVVVAGDLQSSQGVPLKTGQTLFEIAPLEAVRAVSLVPEWEFDRLAPAQSVEFHFDAVPREAFTATVERVLPRAESRFDAWGFPFEATLENPAGRLRPGMRGIAHVAQPRTTLAERLFRRPWRSLRLMTGW